MKQLVSIEDVIVLAREFPCVVVTGPERSGTSIATEMVSSSAGYDNVPEETWDNDFGYLWRLLNERKRIVVHAPHLTFRLHEIDRHCPDRALVVFMLRSPQDIVDSQRRANWGVLSEHCPDGGDPRGWGNPASRWYDAQSYELFRDLIDPAAHLCVNRQVCWRLRQRQCVEHFVEVEYETLRTHPLWLDPADRR